MKEQSANLDGQFAARVRVAIAAFERKFREACDTGQSPPKLSVSGFVKINSLSRSLLYSDHPNLLTEIKNSFSKLRVEVELSKKPKRSPSITALLQEIVDLKKFMKREIASATSVSTYMMLETCGPAFRDSASLVLEVQERDRIISDLRHQLKNQMDMNRQLMAQLNSRTPTILR